MAPIKCIFRFLNAAMFQGISGQTHGVSVKKSQYINCIVLKDQFDVFELVTNLKWKLPA